MSEYLYTCKSGQGFLHMVLFYMRQGYHYASYVFELRDAHNVACVDSAILSQYDYDQDICTVIEESHGNKIKVINKYNWCRSQGRVHDAFRILGHILLQWVLS
jgi:hypothetical protein